jgi:hypothetical protein
MDEPTEDPSGGLCRECITSYIHSKQRKNGGRACFGKPDECNDAERCKYCELCLA